MASEEHEIRKTDDGSTTIYSSTFNQNFHNKYGAATENRYVFFERSGILEALKSSKPITILEIGFGTGLNLILLADFLHEITNPPRIVYQSVEAFPISSDLAKQLDFSDFVTFDLTKSLSAIFGELEPGQNIFHPVQNLELRFFNGFFKDFNASNLNADFIFFDAFSPKANPDLWTADVFKHLKELSSQDVILTTYSAAVQARAAMASGGWLVARAPGVLGKREMTIAALSPSKLLEYKRVDEERLAKRYDGGEFS